MVALRWGSATDVGRVREQNEDSVLARPPVFVVADGMGGHAAGEVASALAVAAFVELEGREAVTRDDVASAIAAGNQRILEAAHDNGESEGMGTTVAGIAVVDQGGIAHWLVFNVGDSRVYRWADEQLTQITVDHSEVQELVADGTITPTEARSHRLRSVVTRALGADPAPEVDWWLRPVVVGERFIVCSDGLFADLGEVDFLDGLRSADPAAAAHRLVELAVAAGGRDNVTVIAVDVDAGPGGEDEIDEDTSPRLAVVPPELLITEVPGVHS